MNLFTTFNSELFHFIRPQWLWLFIPLFIIVLLIVITKDSKAKWKKSIEAHLLPFMVSKANRFAFVAPTTIFALAISLMILIAAGPTWKKIEVPGAKSEAILLIALDLSPSMLVEDVSPNRLERAKFKIRDLLEANPGSKVGLLAFSGTCHPVITPCSDYQLLSYQLESLIPQIMPVQGTNYKHLLAVSDTILNRNEAPNTLLLVTDDIKAEQSELLINFVSNSKNNLEIITLASTKGGRIPGLTKGTYLKENGQFVSSKLNQDVLFKLQKNEKININPLTIGNEDMEELAQKVKTNLVYQSEEEQSEEVWAEMGFGLMWLVLIILVLWFRKGWMVQWSILLFFLSSCSTEVQNWADLWYTKDFQGQQAMNQEEYDVASENYESFSHKGVAYYKAGDYESAIEVFKQDSSVQSLYNLGIAYAANGQNNLANEALLLAQTLDPENETIAQSIKNNQTIIMEIDSLTRFNPDSALELEKEEAKGPLNERKAASKDEELSDDTEVKELPKDGDRVTDEQETRTRKAEEMESPPEDFIGQEVDNAQDVLLREISAEPSEFLKRRFKYQKEKYYTNEKQPNELW